jgi:hypothetical protein
MTFIILLHHQCISDALYFKYPPNPTNLSIKIPITKIYDLIDSNLNTLRFMMVYFCQYSVL